MTFPSLRSTITLAAVTVACLTSCAQSPEAPAEPLSSPSSVALNCAEEPSRCGYPDETNTGVPEGVTLRRVPQDVSSGEGWRFDPRGWVVVEDDGAIFEGFDVAGQIDVTASDVTIRNCRITAIGETFGVSLRTTRNVTVENSEISSPSAGNRRLLVGVKDINGDSTGTRILGNEITHTSTGIQIDAGLVRDNFIHDMGYKDGDHVNGTTSNAGTSLLTLDHNTVFNQLNQTDAISLFQDFGDQANRSINNNLVAGGGYTIYAGANPDALPTSNIRVTNNRVSRIFFPKGGEKGPVTAFNPAGAGNTFTGNVWDDTGEPISP